MGPGYFSTYKFCETFILIMGFFIFLLSLSGYHGPLYLIAVMADSDD